MLRSHAENAWGVTGFLLQRVSSLVLAGYALCLTGYFLMNPVADAEQMRAFFGNLFMRAFSLVALLAFVSHAWVGLWTVGTDYIRPHYFGRYAAMVRSLYHCAVAVMLFGQAVWWLTIIISL